nr:LysR substrate-binding domain-containing protein [Aminobacter aminovorans]
MSRQPATKGGRSSRPHAMLLGWLQRQPLDGQFGLADARAILIKVDAMRAKARGLGQGLELLLAVAVDPVIPASILADTLFDLSAEHPSVGVALTTVPMRSALHALVNRQFTLAITTERQRDRLVEAECLGLVQPFVAVCADHHSLAAVPAAGWSAVELSDHLQIVVSDPSPMSEGLGFACCRPAPGASATSPASWR